MPYKLCIFTWIEKVAFSRDKKGQKMQFTASFVDLATMHVKTRREVHESASFFKGSLTWNGRDSFYYRSFRHFRVSGVP